MDADLVMRRRTVIEDADAAVIAEFELVGTNTGEVHGRPPTGLWFRVPIIAVFSIDEVGYDPVTGTADPSASSSGTNVESGSR